MSPSNDRRPRYYIGIATTFHEPALAIVSPQGEILFAEAAERCLQDKRAIDHRGDPFVHMPELLRRFCDPEGELVVATSWSGLFSTFLGMAGASRQFAFRALRCRSAE